MYLFGFGGHLCVNEGLYLVSSYNIPILDFLFVFLTHPETFEGIALSTFSLCLKTKELSQVVFASESSTLPALSWFQVNVSLSPQNSYRLT